MQKKSPEKEFSVKKEFGLHDALREADRCLLCHDAPCSNGCPATTDPGKFIRQLRFRNIKGAARTIRRNNIMAGVCAEVCPTCTLCVERCSRTEIDRPIQINDIQRFLANYQNEMKIEVFDAPKPLKKKVAVIGAGPAGLSCAATLALEGYDVTVFEKDKTAGGVMSWGIPYYRLSRKTLKCDIKEVERLGVKIKLNTPVEGKKAVEKLLKDGFASVYMSTGLTAANFLRIEGSDLKGVFTSVDFLSLVNDEKNRSKAEAMVKGKKVAVIGGGSVAMDAATSAKILGAERVYSISLEALNELPADIEEIELANKYHVIFKPSTQVAKISGKAGKVSGITGCEIEWKEKGKFTPDNAKPIKGTDFSHNVDAVIFAIGSRVGKEVVEMAADAKVALAKNNLVKIDTKYATANKAVFAGGDLVNGGGTVAYAVFQGKKAAAAIHEFISKGRR